MLRRFLDFQMSLTEEGKPLHFIRPLIQANDAFLYEAPDNTKVGPHIRDAIDVKRWMLMVIIALIPCTLMGIWNTGLQDMVYSSGNYKLMDQYLASSSSFSNYLAFVTQGDHFITIIKNGLYIVLPILLVSYLVGGFWEILFACIRRHEVSEGFLVTGILYGLIMPPTIPLWMVAVGVSAGIVLGKEVFGGSGMNIVNPALICRAFLFFAYPGRMTGSVWVGGDATTVRSSLLKMNQEGGKTALDGYTQATKLAQFNIPPDIKRIQVDALATNDLGSSVSTYPTIEKQFTAWNQAGNHSATLGQLSPEQMREFVTTPLADSGLGLSPGYYEDAYQFSALDHGLGNNSDLGFFFGNKLGCIGETSTLACLLGAFFLIYTGIASWRTMVAMGVGGYLTALFFNLGSSFFGVDGGAFAPAQFGFPAYKHLLLGGFAFGLVFMATEPVTSPNIPGAKWLYGLFIGLVAIVIRVINPAYPEGVMLAILMGNVFAPLFNYYAAQRSYQRRKRARVKLQTA